MKTNKWKVEDAWVGWYCTGNLGILRDYHPDPSPVGAPKPMRLYTEVKNDSQNGKSFKLNIKVKKESANSGKWKRKAKKLIESAIFKPNAHGDVLSSAEMEIRPIFNGNPFGKKYTHVQFHITLSVDPTDRKRVYTTTVRWFKSKPNKEVKNEITTSYPWKEQ
jgi:hypothetical protein